MTYRTGMVALWALGGLVLAGCADRSSPSDPLDPPGAARAPGESNAPSDGREQAAPAPRPSEPSPSDRESERQSEHESDGEPSSDASVTVRVVDEAEFAEAIRRHRGRVVLVDYWATWCLSCLELFPHTVDLSKRLADRGLVVVSLSLDDPDDRSAVLEKLRSGGATFENFISRYGGSDRSAEAFGLEDLVLPKYRIYDRTGAIHTTLNSSAGPLRPDDVERAVEELLARP